MCGDAHSVACEITRRPLEWLQQRAEASREAGASEAEIAERWSCLHAVGIQLYVLVQYHDDSAHATHDASIDELVA